MFFLIEDIEDPFQFPFDYYNLPYVLCAHSTFKTFKVYFFKKGKPFDQTLSL